MLQTQFLLVNAHFTVNLFAGLVAFAVSWLYFDAWLGRHDIKESTKSLGFLMLSLSFVVHATAIEQSVLESSLLGANTIEFLVAFFRIAAYITLMIGQIIDPLQPLPDYRFKKSGAVMLLGLPLVNLFPFTFPLLAALTGFLYVRRATVGLEFHLRAIGYSFFTLSIAEVLSLTSLFRGTDNINLQKIVAPFGPMWLTEHVILILSMLILGKWVWGYLIKRLETQLFMIFTTSTLIVFLATAIFFTSVSLTNLRADILKNLEINVDVLNFTIEGKKNEVLSDAEVIAQDPQVVSAVKDSDKKALREVATTSLLAKNEATLIIVSVNGEIMARAEDPEKIGGSLSDDPLIKKALSGSQSSGVVRSEGVLAPNVSVRASAPVKDGNDIIGATLVGASIDNAFVDGLKDATGLDASVYGDNVRSATTFVAPDGKSRWIGIKEEDEDVKKAVLANGEKYIGSSSVLDVPFLSAYSPLKDVNDSTVGMLFVGRSEVTTILAASKLIEQTFIVTVGLLVVSIFPAYFISKYIIGQISS